TRAGPHRSPPTPRPDAPTPRPTRRQRNSTAVERPRNNPQPRRQRRPDPRPLAGNTRPQHPTGRQPAAARRRRPRHRLHPIHRLAAAVLRQVTGQAHDLARTVRELARDLHELPDAAPPATIPEVAAVVEQVDGVQFTTLVTALAGDLDTAQHALATVIEAARN